jgi:hypothetical protein
MTVEPRLRSAERCRCQSPLTDELSAVERYQKPIATKIRKGLTPRSNKLKPGINKGMLNILAIAMRVDSILVPDRIL